MLAGGRLCGPEERRRCRTESGAFADWACGACDECLRPEAVSPWTWHLVFLYRLSRAGYPFKANDLSLETWLLMGTVRPGLGRSPARTAWPRLECKSSTSQRELEDYRAHQEEMLNLSREYSQARLAVWAEEAQALHETWNGFSQEWQANLEQMTALAGSKFEEMAARGEASAGLLAQSWQKNLADVSGAVEEWGANFLQTLAKVAAAWAGTMGSRGSGQGAGHRFWAGSWISAAGFTRGGSSRPTRGWWFPREP